MNLKDFTEAQRQAMLDLALLAMYADGHLASAEDERVHRLLIAMGCATESDRNREYDTAVDRISRQTQNPEAVRGLVASLARNFTTLEQRKCAVDVLQDLLASDDRVDPQEDNYLAAVRAVLR